MSKQNKYIDLKINGRLFPTWVLANFKKYKLPEYIDDGSDPCRKPSDKEQKMEALNHQLFISKYLDYKSPLKDILLYHGVGSGKTASSITIYNTLYNYTPGWNVFLLVKASLHNTVWLGELKQFLSKSEYEYRYKNIIFIHYDSPFADREFMDAVKNSDSSKKSLYIIDEAHNFIRNVYTNINSKQGKRAQVIYDYIIQDKKENEGVRVVLLSATPAVNVPYELALMFNLLRPNTFPKSETQFNQIYKTTGSSQTINEATKNMFQRRILGLVSYYKPILKGSYADKKIEYINVEMSPYQTDIYKVYEEIEEKMDAQRRKRNTKGGSDTYRVYTRQASNFVFPAIDQRVNGESRPRPNKFRISEREAEKINEGNDEKIKAEKGSDKFLKVQEYYKAMKEFIKAFEDYLDEKSDADAKNKHTIIDDIKVFHEKYKDNYDDFFKNEKKKSTLFDALWTCSAKMVRIIFTIMVAKGPVLVYTNYVLMEGLEIFKIYLNQFGFSKYKDNKSGVDKYRYAEFHGGIDKNERQINKEVYNKTENKDGSIIKIMMISPAGAEGISLRNTREVHIMEPYWNEVRIEQMVGRAIRYCSHRDLPLEERFVTIYRYISVRTNNKITTDQYINKKAFEKENLINSYLDAVKEAAIDCVLFQSQNMAMQSYKCFQFDQSSLFDKQIGPAYKDDTNDDIKIDNGLNSTKSMLMKVKVMKIKAVKLLSENKENPEYSKEENYWYDGETGVVYDYDLHYPLGKILYDDENIPVKIGSNVYVIGYSIPIPIID